jgi:arsenite methyltransferase
VTADAFTTLGTSAGLSVLRGCLHKNSVAEGDILLLGAVTPGLKELVIEANESGAGHGRLVVVEPMYERRAASSDADNSLDGAGPPIVDAALDDLHTCPTTADRIIRAAIPRDMSSYCSIRKLIESASLADPLFADGSFDTVIIDLGLNRLDRTRAKACIAESFRVLRRGGKVLVTAILGDEEPGSISGVAELLQSIASVPVETAMGKLLEDSGFYGISYLWSSPTSFEVAGGAHLRYFIAEAFKGKQGVCLDQGHAVILKGPWKEVFDDDGHRYVRGERTAVCEKTYRILTQEPYGSYFIGLPCSGAPDPDDAPVFDCSTPRLRDPRVTRGALPVASELAAKPLGAGEADSMTWGATRP